MVAAQGSTSKSFKGSFMKYQKPIQLWAEGIQEALISGALKLQPGQCILCGSNKSVFERVSDAGVIIAYHGANYGEARKQYLSVQKDRKLIAAKREALKARLTEKGTK